MWKLKKRDPCFVMSRVYRAERRKMLFSSVVWKRRSLEGGFRLHRDIQDGRWPRKSEQLSIAAFRPEKHTQTPELPLASSACPNFILFQPFPHDYFFIRPPSGLLKGHHIKLWITGDESFYFQFRRRASPAQPRWGRGARDMWAAD